MFQKRDTLKQHLLRIELGEEVLERENTTLIRIAGLCGILVPIVAFTSILLAINFYPQFSWVENALSDLGIVTGITAFLFNYGLIISGILGLVFSVGLLLFLGKKLENRIGACFFALACLSLISIGFFPENVKPTHYLVSVAFFALLPISMFVLSFAFWLVKQFRMTLFTLLIAVFAALPWVLHFSFQYTPGVAIPEALSGLVGSIWVEVLSFKMLKLFHAQ